MSESTNAACLKSEIYKNKDKSLVKQGSMVKNSA